MDEKDHNAAMEAVLGDMERHARQAKARRYAPKPQPAAPAKPDAHDMKTGEITEAELQQLLAQQRAKADEVKDLEVQR